MAEQFRVSLAWLEDLVARMNTAATVADTALKALKETGPIRMGRKSLDNACHDFHDEWKTAVKDLRKDLDTLGKGVAEAKTGYGAAEKAVLDALAQADAAAAAAAAAQTGQPPQGASPPPGAPGTITGVLG